MTVAIADAVAATETPSPVSTSSNVAATKRVVRRSRGQTPARFTVELPHPQHRFLKRFALNEDSDASSVVRALLTLLKEERAVADAVSAMTRALGAVAARPADVGGGS
jgi:Arc/MetJ-type ribon-helix-helix transcriptional regulator